MDRISAIDVVTQWRLDPAPAVVIVVALLAHGRAVRRLAARGHRWSTVRSVWWALAIAGAVVATQSGIGRYDDERLTVHMIQHLLLGMVVPFALVCSAPITLALQTGGPGTRRIVHGVLRHPVARVLTHPVVTWALFGGGMIVLYLTPVLGLAARNDLVHLAVHAHLVGSGSLFLAGLVGSDPMPRSIPHGARLLAILTAVPFHAFLGLAMLSTKAPLAPDAYPSLSDQRTAAALLWGMGELFTLAVAAVVVRRWYVADQRAADRHDRRSMAVATNSATGRTTTSG